MDGDAFERYIETQLAPTLQKGDVVVLDNLPAHKRDDARRAVERRGAWLLFLPPYSPDFNPIENAFAKLKSLLRRAAERSVQGLWSAIGAAVGIFGPQQRANYFATAGYERG